MRLLAVIGALLLIIPIVFAATNDCRIVNPPACPPGDSQVAYLSEDVNGHLTVSSVSSFTKILCCDSDVDDSNANTLFRVSNSAGSQGHVCAPGSTSCATTVTGSLQSCVTTTTLAADQICMLRISGSQQGHVADCSDTTFSNMVACRNTIVTCDDVSEGTSCVADGSWDVPGSTYCSTGLNGNGPPSCCPEGEYWDPVQSPITGECVTQNPCYDISDSNLCNFFPDDSRYYTSDRADCANIPQQSSCCNIGDIDMDGADNWEDLPSTSRYRPSGSLDPTRFNRVNFCQNAVNDPPPGTLICSPTPDGICPEVFVPGLTCTPLDADCPTPAVTCEASSTSIVAGGSVDYTLRFQDTPAPGERCDFDPDTPSGPTSYFCTQFVPERTISVTYNVPGTKDASLTRSTNPGSPFLCPQVTVAAGPEICGNGIDDDVDGDTDYCDSDCASSCAAGFAPFSCTSCASCSVSPASIPSGDTATTTLYLDPGFSSGDCRFYRGDGTAIYDPSCDDFDSYNYQYNFPGNYTPRFVNLDTGNSVSCSNFVTVGNSCVDAKEIEVPSSVFANIPATYRVNFEDDTVGTQYTIEWTNPAFSSETGVIPVTGPYFEVSHTYATPGLKQMSVVLEDANGCVAPTLTATVNVLPAPSIGVSCSVADTTLNSTSQLDYTITNLGTAPARPYLVRALWGDAQQSTQTIPGGTPLPYSGVMTHDYLLNDNYPVTLSVEKGGVIGVATCSALVSGPPQVSWDVSPDSANVPVVFSGAISVFDEVPGFDITVDMGIGAPTIINNYGFRSYVDTISSPTVSTPQTLTTSANVTDVDSNVEYREEIVDATCVPAGGSTTVPAACCAGTCHNSDNDLCYAANSCETINGNNVVCDGAASAFVDPDISLNATLLNVTCGGTWIPVAGPTCEQTTPPPNFADDDLSNLLRCDTADGGLYSCGDDGAEFYADYDLVSSYATVPPQLYHACLNTNVGCFAVDKGGNPEHFGGVLPCVDADSNGLCDEVCSDTDSDNDCDGLFPIEDSDCQSPLIVNVRIEPADIADPVVYPDGAEVTVFYQGSPLFSQTTMNGVATFPNAPAYETLSVEVDLLGYVENTPSFEMEPDLAPSPYELDVVLVERICNDDCSNQFGVCDQQCWGLNQCGALSAYESGVNPGIYDFTQYENQATNPPTPMYNTPQDARAASFEVLMASAPQNQGLSPRSPGQEFTYAQGGGTRDVATSCAVPYHREAAPVATVDSDTAESLIKFTRTLTYQGRLARLVIATGK